jgi:Fe-S cluster biogenesis protein NfuA
MKMGIERVLLEHFPQVQVVQVEDEGGKPTELTFEAVEQEVKRIQPAIIAMGGVVEIIKVDSIGEVTLHFRGANKVRQGLEMALLDIPFCKNVKFVTA